MMILSQRCSQVHSGSTVRLGAGSPDEQLGISLSGAVWVRVYPTYSELEQREDYVSTTEGEQSESEDILPVFTKLEFESEISTASRSQLEELAGGRGKPEPITETVSDIFENLKTRAAGRSDIYLVDPDNGSQKSIPDWALESENDYQTFLEEIEENLRSQNGLQRSSFVPPRP